MSTSLRKSCSFGLPYMSFMNVYLFLFFFFFFWGGGGEDTLVCCLFPTNSCLLYMYMWFIRNKRLFKLRQLDIRQ